MILVPIFVISAGCFFNLRFLWALHRELQADKQAQRVRMPKLVEERGRRRIPLATTIRQQETPCATYYSLESR